MTDDNTRYYINLKNEGLLKDDGDTLRSWNFQPGRIVTSNQMVSGLLSVRDLPSFLIHNTCYDWDLCRVEPGDDVEVKLPRFLNYKRPGDKSKYVDKLRMLYRISEWNYITAYLYSFECVARILTYAKNLGEKYDFPLFEETLELINIKIELLRAIDLSRIEKKPNRNDDLVDYTFLLYRGNHPVLSKLDAMKKKISELPYLIYDRMYTKNMFLELIDLDFIYKPATIARGARLAYTYLKRQFDYKILSDDEEKVRFISYQIDELNMQTEIFCRLVHEF